MPSPPFFEAAIGNLSSRFAIRLSYQFVYFTAHDPHLVPVQRDFAFRSGGQVVAGSAPFEKRNIRGRIRVEGGKQHILLASLHPSPEGYHVFGFTFTTHLSSERHPILRRTTIHIWSALTSPSNSVHSKQRTNCRSVQDRFSLSCVNKQRDRRKRNPFVLFLSS